MDEKLIVHQDHSCDRVEIGCIHGFLPRDGRSGNRGEDLPVCLHKKSPESDTAGRPKVEPEMRVSFESPDAADDPSVAQEARVKER